VNFVADESLDDPLVIHLRTAGHTVWSVAEMTPGISDDIVLELANQQRALLLTADKDFGELVFRLRRIATGIILVRLSGLSMTKKAEILIQAIQQHSEDLMQSFTVIQPGIVRIRPLK
jgi:predicted nuclease of predicted toxin-antitoxin system